MVKDKKVYALISALGAGGEGLVLSGFVQKIMSNRGTTLEMFLTFEITGIFLIIMGILIYYKK